LFFLSSFSLRHADPKISLLVPLAATPIYERHKDRLVFDNLFSDLSNQYGGVALPARVTDESQLTLTPAAYTPCTSSLLRRGLLAPRVHTPPTDEWEISFPFQRHGAV